MITQRYFQAYLILLIRDQVINDYHIDLLYSATFVKRVPIGQMTPEGGYDKYVSAAYDIYGVNQGKSYVIRLIADHDRKAILRNKNPDGFKDLPEATNQFVAQLSLVEKETQVFKLFNRFPLVDEGDGVNNLTTEMYCIERNGLTLYYEDGREMCTVEDMPPTLELVPYLNTHNTDVTIIAGTPYKEPGYKAWDLEDGDITHLVRIRGNRVEHVIPGIYDVIYEVGDSEGQVAIGRRRVTVLENNPPTLDLLGDIRLVMDINTNYVEPGYTAHDAEDGDLTYKVEVYHKINTRIAGSYVVRYLVWDKYGRSAFAERIVTVSEHGAPVLTPNPAPPRPFSPVSDNTRQYLCLGEDWVDPGCTAIDNEDGDLTNFILVSSTITSAIGVYYVTYSVTDTDGNVGTTIRVVERIAPKKPTIILAGGNTVKMVIQPEYIEDGAGFSIQNPNYSPWIDPGYYATDDYGSDLPVILSGDTVRTDVLGNYTIAYTATGVCGSQTTVYRNVEIVLSMDNSGPQIDLYDAREIFMAQTDDAWVEPGYYAYDAEDGDLTNQVISSKDIDLSILGVQLMTYFVVDSDGLMDVDTRKVTILPLNGPKIVLYGRSSVKVPVGGTYVEEGFKATDIEDGDITDDVVIWTELDLTKANTYRIHYQVRDSDNLFASATRIVEVLEYFNIPPILTLFGPTYQEVLKGTTWEEDGYRAEDIEDGDITDKVNVYPTVNTEVSSVYIRKYTVIDSDNARSTKSRVIVVLDTLEHLPVIDLIGGDTVRIPMNTPWVELGYTAHDIEDGDLTNSVVIGGQTVIPEDPGMYAIVYSVSDSTGRVGTATRMVVVYDPNVVGNAPPVISLIGNATPRVALSTTWEEPGYIAWDLEDGDLTPNVAVYGDTVIPYKLGTYTIQYSVMDSWYQVATVTRVVEVVEDTGDNFSIITIDLLGDNPMYLALNEPFVDPGATAHDTLEGNITNHIVVTGAVNTVQVGTYILTYSVSNAAGDTASVTRIVNVGMGSGGGGGTTLTLDKKPMHDSTDIVMQVSPKTAIDRYWLFAYQSPEPRYGHRTNSYVEKGNFEQLSLVEQSVEGDIRVYAGTKVKMTDGFYVPDNELIDANRTGTAPDSGFTVYATVGPGNDAVPTYPIYGLAYQYNNTHTVTHYYAYNQGVESEVFGQLDNAVMLFYKDVPQGADPQLDNGGWIQLWDPETPDVSSNTLLENEMAFTVAPAVKHTAIEEPGYTATDASGNDITADVVVDDSTVDFTKVGEYEVTYTITDSFGDVTTETRTVFIESYVAPIVSYPNREPDFSPYKPSWDIVLADETWDNNKAIVVDEIDGVIETTLTNPNFGAYPTWGLTTIRTSAVNSRGVVSEIKTRQVMKWHNLSMFDQVTNKPADGFSNTSAIVGGVQTSYVWDSFTNTTELQSVANIGYDYYTPFLDVVSLMEGITNHKHISQDQELRRVFAETIPLANNTSIHTYLNRWNIETTFTNTWTEEVTRFTDNNDDDFYLFPLVEVHENERTNCHLPVDANWVDPGCVWQAVPTAPHVEDITFYNTNFTFTPAKPYLYDVHYDISIYTLGYSNTARKIKFDSAPLPRVRFLPISSGRRIAYIPKDSTFTEPGVEVYEPTVWQISPTATLDLMWDNVNTSRCGRYFSYVRITDHGITIDSVREVIVIDKPIVPIIDLAPYVSVDSYSGADGSLDEVRIPAGETNAEFNALSATEPFSKDDISINMVWDDLPLDLNTNGVYVAKYKALDGYLPRWIIVHGHVVDPIYTTDKIMMYHDTNHNVESETGNLPTQDHHILWDGGCPYNDKYLEAGDRLYNTVTGAQIYNAVGTYTSNRRATWEVDDVWGVTDPDDTMELEFTWERDGDVLSYYKLYVDIHVPYLNASLSICETNCAGVAPHTERELLKYNTFTPDPGLAIDYMGPKYLQLRVQMIPDLVTLDTGQQVWQNFTMYDGWTLNNLVSGVAPGEQYRYNYTLISPCSGVPDVELTRKTRTVNATSTPDFNYNTLDLSTKNIGDWTDNDGNDTYVVGEPWFDPGVTARCREPEGNATVQVTTTVGPWVFVNPSIQYKDITYHLTDDYGSSYDLVRRVTELNMS